jgi:hypothetical protein
MNLSWIPYTETFSESKKNQSRITRSKGWDFMGNLIITNNSKRILKEGHENEKSLIFDAEHLFCKFCFADEMEKSDGLLSKVYKSSTTTSTGNWIAHATAKHSGTFQNEQMGSQSTANQAKIIGWLQKVKESTVANSHFDFNRDLALMICRDLQPFSVVERQGFTDFCLKNIGFELPSSHTLASTALIDVYCVLKRKVIDVLKECTAGTLMMDGWTDRYRGQPYFAIRISIVHEWKFKIITLSTQPVETHTSANLFRFVKGVMADFLPANRKFLLFNTTDGAANMLSLSNMLGHERVTCFAHCIHLLVTTDSFSKEPEMEILLARCKQSVTTLHFKGHMIETSVANAANAELFAKVEHLQQIVQADEDNPICDCEELDSDNSDTAYQSHTKEKEPLPAQHNESKQREHKTLKNSVPTRWNSVLTMVESILDLRQAVTEVLKKLGKAEMCLDEEDYDILEQVRKFLKPFKDLTLLISEACPNLSVVPLMRTKILKVCTIVPSDAPVLVRIKKRIVANIEKRIPLSKLVKISAALDPALRDIILQKDECSRLLEDTYNYLEKSRYAEYIFPNAAMISASSLSSVGATSANNLETASEDAVFTAKRMCLSLIQDASLLQSTEADSHVKAEIRKYIGIWDDSTALEFWEKNNHDFPILSSMARIYLSISSGSVPVECLFSTLGIILNGKRSALMPHRTNMISFIHDNYYLL